MQKSNRRRGPGKSFDYRSSNSVYKLFLDLAPEKIRALEKKILRLCLKKDFTYEDKKGKAAVIPLMLRPRLLTRPQRDRIWAICQILNRAFEKAHRYYLEDPKIREIFPFEENEKRWIIDTLKSPAVRRGPGAIFSRWDANTSFHGKKWPEDFVFFENNGVGVGGVWYCPVGEEILLETVIPALRKLDPGLALEKNHDARYLLMKFLVRHGKALGRKNPLIALMIDRSEYQNFVEFVRLEKFFGKRGVRAVVADPRAFESRRGEIYHQGRKIDVIYRDTTVQEFAALEKKGANLAALRLAFLKNRIVSSIGGEFDHKSLFEFFTNPAFGKYFTQAESLLLSKHILWTRMLREIKTEGPQGRPIDLIPFIRKNKNRFVIKPNRLFGGEGVLIGAQASQSQWETHIGQGLAKPGDKVVQAHGTVYKKRFPVLKNGTLVASDQFYVNTGFISTADGLGILGRVSKRKVVNVARKGGISAFLISQQP